MANQPTPDGIMKNRVRRMADRQMPGAVTVVGRSCGSRALSELLWRGCGRG